MKSNQNSCTTCFYTVFVTYHGRKKTSKILKCLQAKINKKKGLKPSCVGESPKFTLGVNPLLPLRTLRFFNGSRKDWVKVLFDFFFNLKEKDAPMLFEALVGGH
jgi:hypothetical protein